MGIPAPRTVDQVMAEIMAVDLPKGWAWNGDPCSNLGKFFRPLADAIATFEAAAVAQLEEIDPRTAVQLLPDYERVLGPDPCGRDALPLTEAQMQALVFQRWTARGGQSIAFFVALAAAMGVTISINESIASRCGQMRCGQRLVPVSQAFVWQVVMPTVTVVPFRTGVSRCGQRLGAFAAPLVACMIQLFAPAHTTPVFSYTG